MKLHAQRNVKPQRSSLSNKNMSNHARVWGSKIDTLRTENRNWRDSEKLLFLNIKVSNISCFLMTPISRDLIIEKMPK